MLLFALIHCLCGTFVPLARADQPTPFQMRLTALASGNLKDVDGKKIASWSFLPKLYAALNYRLVWTRTEDVKALSEAVARSWEDGLLESDFHSAFVKAEAAAPTTGIDREIILSDALVRLLYQLYFGKVAPNGLDPNWNFARPVLAEDPAVTIAAALSSGQIKDLIERARVKHPLYSKLKAVLQEYTNYEVSGGWGTIPQGKPLKAGDTDPRVADLRKRLSVTGEYRGKPAADVSLFDAELAQALKLFQSLHGLEPDGVLGGDTFASLNVSAHDRVEQIRVNLERGRWLLRTLSPDMVVVNVAGHYLHLFFKGENVWSTRVIVGKTYTKTPIFTEAMKTIVFNPDWTVPRSIVRNEIYPKALADPNYLANNNYYLVSQGGAPVELIDWSTTSATNFPYGVVQRPGPRNALGLVKFLFPNKFSVYLHDTPSRQLFDKAGRNFSHGCIRVENPLKLAELIMQNQRGWNRDKIDALVSAGKMQSVSLPQPLPVLVLYWTVDPSPDTGTAFYKDNYGRDAALLKALNAEFSLKGDK